MLRQARTHLAVQSASRTHIVIFALVVFFWSLADALGQYIAPLLLQQHGFSSTMIGLIIGTSSIAGALFDFVACAVLKNTNFRRFLLAMFAICLVYPLVLWQANSVWWFLFAMALWGIYFDLYNISMFDFISRHTTSEQRVSGFVTIQFFKALATIIAPLIVALVIVGTVDWRAFGLFWLFISIAILFFGLLWYVTRNYPTHHEERHRKKHFLAEARLWRKIGKILLPMLLLTAYLFIIEAYFWTLAPLIAETVEFKGFGGFLLMAYNLPTLLVAWFISPIMARFSKKRFAYGCLFLGSLILIPFAFVSSPLFLIGLIFASSLLTSMSLPAVNAAYADYISSASYVEGEIETLEDMAMNVGYILGPISAGLLADLSGMGAAFSILGAIGALLALGLLVLAPKHITRHMQVRAHSAAMPGG